MPSNKTSGHGPGYVINVREIFGPPLAAHQVTPGIKIVAETVCNKIGVIDRGLLLALGTISEIKNGTGANNLEDAFVKLIS